MKILFNVMTLSKGGAERVINILSNEFVLNNDVQIIANIKSDIAYQFNPKVTIKFLSNKNIRSKIVRKMSRLSIKKLFKLKKEICEYNPDIIISFLPEPCLRILLVKKVFKNFISCPIIITERNDPNMEFKNNLFYLIMKKLYPLADGFVFQTNDAQDYFKNIINCKQKIILNPLDDSFINFTRISNKRKKEIVTVGRLEKQKNHLLLIDSLKIINEKYKDYVLKIYGEGSERENISNYIVKNHLEEKVFLMGNVSNVKEYIKDATVFVLSSDYEGLPNALIEAMALGIPCISTDCPCGGPKMLIRHKENGMLVSTKDKETLANAIIELIENSDLQNIISKNSMKIKEKLSKNIIVQEWFNFIYEVKK